MHVGTSERGAAWVALLWVSATAMATACGGSTITEVNAGKWHVCVTDAKGRTDCTPYNVPPNSVDSDNWNDDPEYRVRGVSNVYAHSCGLLDDDSLYCWGYELFYDPIPVGPFVKVSAGDYHSCALREDGEAVCWGMDWDTAAFGSGSDPYVLGEGPWVDVAAGESVSCGINTEGRIHCVGWDKINANIAPEGSDFASLYTGTLHFCALDTQGAATCWGDVEEIPEAPRDERFVDLAMGIHHVCGLRSDGTVSCWGEDLAGQSSPPEGVRFKDIDAGFRFTCGLTVEDEVACWGCEQDDPGLCVAPG